MPAPTVQYATGKQPTIGFDADTAIANAMRDEENHVEIGDVEEVEDEAGAVCAAVTSDLGVEVSANGTALTGLALPEVGDSYAIGGVTGYINGSPALSRSPTLCRFNFAIRKEDSITTIGA